MDFSSEVIENDLELQFLPTEGSIKDFYRIGKQISSFGSGQVRICISRDTEIKRAVKILAKNQMSDDDVLTLFKQVRILKELDHPNIVKIYEFFEDSKRYYLVIDICKGGELFDFIVQKGQLSEQETALLMKQLLTCANYCH